jgi:hypothetical protein
MMENLFETPILYVHLKENRVSCRISTQTNDLGYGNSPLLMGTSSVNGPCSIAILGF